MSSDASAAAASPMTNGTAPQVNREADASATNSHDTKTLAEVCADLHSRVQNFLSADSENDAIRRTQEQTRTAMNVIQKALQDYEYVNPCPA